MTVEWNGHTEGDDYLDNQLHAIDECFVTMFAADVDNPDQVARFFDLIAAQAESEPEQTRQEANFRNAIGETGKPVSDVTEPLPVIRPQRAIQLSGSGGIIAIALGMVALLATLLVVSGLSAAPGPEAKLNQAGVLEKPDQ